MPAMTLSPERRWIVRSHIGWGGVRNILYKGVKTSSSIRILKTLRESPKRTISANGVLEPLNHTPTSAQITFKESI